MSYTIETNGKKITLPDFKSLPVGVVRRARKLDPEEAMWAILEDVLDEKEIAILDSMGLDEFGAAISGWSQGAAVGESSESSS